MKNQNTMRTTRPTSARFDRRRFLERLGLGAGAAVLAPVAEALVSEAWGQTPTRKRFVVYLCGGGLSPFFNFTPPEFVNGDDTTSPVLNAPKAYTWPVMLKPLERYRNSMMLIDGLANEARASGIGHSMGYASLTCVPGQTTPGGPSIDQYIAGKIGATTARKSVLFGVSGGPVGSQATRVFASAAQQPEPFFLDADRLYDDLFGALGSGGTAGRQALLDSLRFDIKRLSGALAGPERTKLDVYLATIDDFQNREKALQANACNAGAAPVGAAAMRFEDRLSLMNDMATVALSCNMTSVVGVSCMTGNPHSFFPVWKKNTEGTQFADKGFNGGIGHSPGPIQGPAMDIVHGYNASLIARTADALSKIKEGNGTAFDNTVAIYLSDNAEAHHANHKRWPMVVVGTAGGKLRSDGRFVRYPKKGDPGNRSVADFYCTLATAVGAPTSDFGNNGWEKVTGPIAELLA